VANNLSTIGFAFADDREFVAAVTVLAAQAVEFLSTPVGDYAIWRSRTGAELWFHLGPEPPAGHEREILGLTPFFQGKSEVPLKVTAAVQRPTDNPFEGLLTAWVAPDETGEGAYPASFEAVDFAAHSGRPLPGMWRAQISGFARELEGYRSGAAYEESQTREPRLAAKAFIPVGLFASAASGNGERAPEQISATALLTGRVSETSLMTNEATGRQFHWLLVESHEATFDVVADPDVVTGEIVRGGAVEALVQLFGRILD
jgi:hypothetical protein